MGIHSGIELDGIKMGYFTQCGVLVGEKYEGGRKEGGRKKKK